MDATLQQTLQAKAYALLAPYTPASAHSSRPHITLAFAQSLNARISANAHPSRQQTLLSCPESLVLTHALRQTHDAILVGINTVVADTPSLTTRHVTEGPGGEGVRHAAVVVVDRDLRVGDCKWKRPVVVYGEQEFGQGEFGQKEFAHGQKRQNEGFGQGQNGQNEGFGQRQNCQNEGVGHEGLQSGNGHIGNINCKDKNIENKNIETTLKERAERLQSQGARLIKVRVVDGRLDMEEAMLKIREMGIRSVMVEGGVLIVI